MADEQAEIRKKRAKLVKERKKAQEAVDVIDAQLEALARRCDHPNMVLGRDISGGPDGTCPDCGYSV